jgi:PAS domain S-box-containing protein
LPGFALDAAAVAICVVDPDSRIVRWNQAAASLTGISADRIKGHIVQSILLFPDDVDRWKCEFGRICAGLDPRRFETRWKIHDGSPLSLVVSCAAIRNSAGNVRYIVCTVIDSLSRIDNLSGALMTDAIAESRDMAGFLHDTISQDLVALSYNLSYLETLAVNQPARSHAGSALDLVDRCCRFIRAMSFMLAPPSPPETSLEESIRQYVDEVCEETGLRATACIDSVSATVPIEAQSLLFAAVQKWIAQGVSARGKRAISVHLANRGAGMVLEMETVRVASEPSVECRPRALNTGWTLIRERTRALGGEFIIGGDSTRTFARISLPD